LITDRQKYRGIEENKNLHTKCVHVLNERENKYNRNKKQKKKGKSIAIKDKFIVM